MAPFKFGKKKKDDAFSPNKQTPQKAQSPQNSNVSDHSNGTRSRDTSNPTSSQGMGSTPVGHSQGSQSSLNSPQIQQQQQQQNGQYYNQQYAQKQTAAIGYDQNNNMYNQMSPQRQPHQQTPHQQYSYSPQRGNNGAPPPPRFQHPQQQSVATPWSRSKLLISPFPRYRHSASQFANDQGEIFVMGGLHNTSVYGDTWIIKPEADGKTFSTAQIDIYDNSPAPRVGHAATTCGNAFVVFGGDTVTNDDGEIDNDLYLFNMNSHSWTIPHPVGRKPSGRYGHSIGVIAITNFDSKIYLYGGQLDDTIYSDLCVFNLSSFRRPDVSWEWVTPADSVRPPPLTNHTMDVYDNKLWIFGGSNGKSLSNDLWSYDPLSNKWDKHKTYGAIPVPCEEHASVIYKDCLIVYGGKDSYGEAIGDLSLFNMITRTWFKLPVNLTGTPKGKYGHSLSILKGDRLLILGGHLPDYAELGDNLEPSVEDNGVGTLLNTLDLSNLEKIIPGFQQYRTPGNIRDQERFQGPQSIFTPPQAEQNSPQKEVASSPEAYQAAAGVQRSTSRSAKDVFERERQVERQTPQKMAQQIDQKTPSFSRGHQDQQNIYPTADEEELPLQIPSPVRSAAKTAVPAPLPKDDWEETPLKNKSYEQQASEAVASMPGSFAAESTYDEKDQRSLDDDFQTPSTSPNKQQEALAPAPVLPYDGPAKNRDSDFLDNYVNGNSTPDLVDSSEDKLQDLNNSRDLAHSSDIEQDFSTHTHSFTKPDATETSIASTTSSTGKTSGVIGAGIAGVAASAAAITGLSSSGKKTPSPTLLPNEIKSPVGSMGVARSVSINRKLVSDSQTEKAEFQNVIMALSRELENLKMSTNEQMKAASVKVNALESENNVLKEQVSKYEETSRDIPKPEDESEIKRKHIKLNTEYELMNQEHESTKSKLAELESLFSSNLFDLQKLNNLIKEQSQTLEQQNRELENQSVLKQQYQELQFKYDALVKEMDDSQSSASKSFLESHEEVKKLNTGLDSFLAHYLVTDESTGETRARSLSGPSTDASSNVTKQLQSQIEELLKDNEDVHTQKKSLEQELETLQSTKSEVEILRVKVVELSKIEENYKESLHSVNTATRALQLSQSELAKEKETTSKLQHEVDELKLFRAKKSSRNATPILAQQDQKMKTDDEDEDDVANAHYNLKIRDLQAELYIIKKERDDIKEEAMDLKKKLYNADNPSGSF